MFVHDNMTIKWEDDGKRYCLHIQPDSEPSDPRMDDHIATMACWHNRRSLGDDIGKMQPYEFWQSLVRENVPESDVNEAAIAGKIQGVSVRKNEENPELYDISIGNDSFEGLRKENIIYYVLDELTVGQGQALLKPYMEWLPLWLYDHSGITMSCGSANPYSDSWDSGQVGYVFVLKDRIISEFGLDPDDNSWREKAEAVMRGEVEEYDQYISGEVYGYSLYEFVDDGTDDGSWDEVDSCSGFYGNELEKNGILDYVGHNIQEAINADEYEIGEASLHTCSYWAF